MGVWGWYGRVGGGCISYVSWCQGLLVGSGMYGKWIRGVRNWGNWVSEGGLVRGLGLHFDEAG